MTIQQLTKLPAIKRNPIFKTTTLSISRIERSSLKYKETNSQRCKRKLSLNPNQLFTEQKQSKPRKRFFLKRIETDRVFKSHRLSEKNTDDNSESDKNLQMFEDYLRNSNKENSVINRAVSILQNMSEVEKITKLYKKRSDSRKQNEQNIGNCGENRRILKNKYKCLVKQHIFDKKLKHNKSNVIQDQKINPVFQKFTQNEFWKQVNQSLILQNSKNQQPSRQLFELVENIITQ